MKESEFQQAVSGLPFEKAAFFESIGSTNDVVAEWAEDGARGFCIAAADEQTSGRGRSGRRWFTPPGSALAFSLLLDPPSSLDQAVLGRASGLGALAVCGALEGLGLRPEIKWPNDVLLDGRKVAGILPEANWTGGIQLQTLILGIGINVAPPSVPPENEISFPATSIEDVLGKKVNVSLLLRSALQNVIKWRNRGLEAQFIANWDEKLAYKGKQVRIEMDGTSLEGEILGLADDGGLKMQVGGKLQVFHAGEIQQLRPSDK